MRAFLTISTKIGNYRFLVLLCVTYIGSVAWNREDVRLTCRFVPFRERRMIRWVFSSETTHSASVFSRALVSPDMRSEIVLSIL